MMLDDLFPDGADGFLSRYPGAPFHADGDPARLPSFIRELSLDWLAARYQDDLDVHAADSRPVSVRASDRDAILWLFRRSAGLTFDRIERLVPGLADWCVELAVELGLPPQAARPRCNAFASPGASGYQFHFHYEGALLVQLEGRKTARLAPVRGGTPIVQTDANLGFESGFGSEPRSMAAHAQFAAAGFPASPAEEECTTYALVPGSVLYIPPGFWHATSCPDERSFAFNFFIATPRWSDVFLRALELALLVDPRWREPVPRGVPSGATLESFGAALARAASGLRVEDLLLCLGAKPAVSESSTLCPNPDARWSVERPGEPGEVTLHVRTENDYAIDTAPRFAGILGVLLGRTAAFTLARVAPEVPATRDELVRAIELLESVGALRRGPFAI